MGHENETLKNVKVSETLHGKMCVAVALYKDHYVNIKTFLEKAITHELENIHLPEDQSSPLRELIVERKLKDGMS